LTIFWNSDQRSSQYHNTTKKEQKQNIEHDFIEQQQQDLPSHRIQQWFGFGRCQANGAQARNEESVVPRLQNRIQGFGCH
jgi:hypothetical protein